MGAWAAAALLAGEAPLGVSFGPLSSISFEASGMHEPLDDLVVLSSAEPPARFTASVKSFDMLRGSKLEADFVGDAWRRRLAEDFDPKSELLGFVSASGAYGNWRSLMKLIRHASSDDPDRLAMRLAEPNTFNKTDRKLWSSAALPPAVASEVGPSAPVSPGVLLSRAMPLRLDFDMPNSEAAAQALRWCDQALAPGQALGPEELWSKLLEIVAQVRPDGGTLDWSSLSSQLEGFTLALRADARHDWALLEAHTQSALATVRDVLGSGFHLPREAARMALTDQVSPRSTVVLTGLPGCGKTALAAAWATEEPARALMLRTWDLDGGLAGLRSRVGLRSPLQQSLVRSERPVRVLIDALDNGGDSVHFAAAAEITRTAAELPHVQVVITCSELALGRVLEALQSSGAEVPASTVTLGNLTGQELEQALSERADLRRLVDAGELVKVLDRPKLLDLVLQLLDRVGPEPLAEAHDETTVAAVWWNRIASGAHRRTERVELLTGLAVSQADALRSSTLLGDLGPLNSFAAVADDLRADGVLAGDELRYAFAHELYGDWARMEWLSSRDDRLAAVAGRSQVPSWHRAIRLIALLILREEGVDGWSAAHARLAGGEEPLLGELFLDAPLLTSDAERVLEQLWQRLIADDGALLNRSLNRFRSVASIPDRQHEQLISTLPWLAMHWAAIARQPLQSLWPGVLRVLAHHSAEAARLAPAGVADLINLWLRSDHRGTEGDADASALGLALLALLLDQSSKVVYDDDVELSMWRAALAAGAVCNKEVSEAVRSVLRDADPSETVGDALDSDPVRQAVLTSDTVIPLARSDSAAAADLVVSCALTPGSKDSLEAWADAARQLEITDPPLAIAMPETGPFFGLLQIAPGDGVRVIVAIAEHATTRWAEGGGVHRESDALDGRTFEIFRHDEWVRLVGDSDVMHWHRGHSTTPAILASALMALERWLYDRIAEGASVDDVLMQMLASSSLALIGVAVDVACFRPELLLGPLAPLISSAGVLLADRMYKRHDHPDLALAGAPEPAAAARLAIWNALPHRAVVLNDLLMSTVLNHVGLGDELSRARARWAQTDPVGWRYILAQTDRANYQVEQTTMGPTWRVVLPEELRDEVQRDQPGFDQTIFWMSFPERMRGLLDATHTAVVEDPQALWDEGQTGLAGEPPADLAQMGIRVREDAACALAAMLIVRHEGWLAEHANKAQWCRTQLLRALADPPRDFTAGPDDPAVNRWDLFCAEAVPMLLAASPQDRELRTATARLIATPRLQRVSATFRRFSDLPTLREDLGRLEHLSLHVARTLAWQAECAHRRDLARQGSPGPGVEDLPDLAAMFDREAERFVRGELAPIAPLVSAFLADSPRDFMRVRVRDRNRLSLAMDPDYLIAANHHRLSPDTATEPERTRRMEFVVDLAELLAESLGADEPERRNRPRDRWQRQLLRALGVASASLPADEAARVWTPLLALGDLRGAGFETYLRALWLELLSTDPTRDGAGALLARLFATLESLHWAPHARSEIVLAAAGVDRYQLPSWHTRHRPLLTALKAKWERWVAPHAHSSYVAAELARFAARRAADRVRPVLLSWLATVAPNPGTWREQLDASLGELLAWLHATSGLLRDLSPEGEDARRILAALTARGDRLAIALSDQLR